MKTTQQSVPKLAEALGIPELYLKREDQHPYGSHKGRSIPLMVKQYAKKENIRHFVISSSGNAALAAAIAVRQHKKNNPNEPVTLDIYIGQHIDPEKEKKMLEYVDDTINIHRVDRPKQAALEESKQESTKLLRQSTDELALIGYTELADELRNIPNLFAMFIPTSSGTCAMGIGNALKTYGITTELHIAQTTACHPIADAFDTSRADMKTETSLASAIVDHVAHRKQALVSMIQESRGGGWIVTDEELRGAIHMVKTLANVEVTANGALAVAGLARALKEGWRPNGAVVCIVGGR